MEKAKINSYQLFALIYLFEIGTAIVVGLGAQAKQDAWLAILLGLISGLVLYVGYQYLFKQYPFLPLTSYVPIILGKFVGYPIAFLYVLWFIYDASRDLRDVGELLLSSSLHETPLLVINLVMISLSIFAVYKGIETIARAGEVLIVVVFTYVIFGVFFMFASNVIQAENLLPVLENGWKPVLKTAFPLTMTFPFGEMIVFTMLLPYLNKPNAALKMGLLGMLLSGLVLSLIVTLEIATLGAQLVDTSMFPLLKTVQKINIGNIIQRLDAIVMSTLILGGFFKITLLYYAAVIGIQGFFKKLNQKYIIYGIGLTILITSIKIAKNLSEHLYIGLKIVPFYVHLPIQVGFPFLLISVAFIRKKFQQNKKSS